MAAGVPVVTTQIGARGLEVENGRDILIGNTPAEMAQLAIKLLKDKKLFKKIIVNAKDLIRRKYDWEVMSADLEKIYEETAKKS